MGARAGDSRLIVGCTDEPFGYVQAIVQERAPKKLEAPNGAGETVAVDYTDDADKVTGQYLFLNGLDAGSDPFEQVGEGQEFTLASPAITIRFDKVSRGRQVGQWCTCSFEGTYYKHLVAS